MGCREDEAMGKLDGRVAVISGAARGQGRSHAIRLAEEGADIIAFDICRQINSVPYPMATEADLQETVSLVEKMDRRIYARSADVRDPVQVQAVIDEGVAEFGRLDIVVANAGIGAWMPFTELPQDVYLDGIAVMMHGPYYMCRAAVPYMIEAGRGGSIVIISSSAGLKGYPNQIQYTMAKHGIVGLMRGLANELAPHFIRANTIHPTSVNTDMINNSAVFSLLRPDLANPTRADVVDVFTDLNLLPIPWVEPVDISNAVVWLASDDARYVTGVTLPVDAGSVEKF
jgi:(+)-trans-carveol dehydrogenase